MATPVEYGLVATLVSVVIIGAVATVGEKLAGSKSEQRPAPTINTRIITGSFDSEGQHYVTFAGDGLRQGMTEFLCEKNLAVGDQVIIRSFGRGRGARHQVTCPSP